MRLKDDNKTEAIFEATIQLLNEIGFAETSMSKIAKRAGVSAATIYVYFQNKEDMLGKLYLNVKQQMSRRMFQGFADTAPVQEGFELVVRNYLEFILNNKDEFLFIEQFTNSPLLQNLCLEESGSLFNPIYELFEQGKRQGLFKQEDTRLLITYAMFPLAQLAKDHYNGTFPFDRSKMSTVIQMSWDAIKA
ncbi:TetR/AcrR family transcriptional regulator [Paenibacillus doosanensis]|uniref:TetR/AcrR family transcriptional regulator n=1 Tax=Paenibacillus doosanensis TaxID=1229154 RepID=UPI0021801A43|nr:TetR/AcrR family transcriptional regulator [Paenibacillus doosanensis]MCS7459677.1 TetR/AcrR family transcriptional regulator [Paenibacillus doosanensis]